jgi:hypothetical protein
MEEDRKTPSAPGVFINTLMRKTPNVPEVSTVNKPKKAHSVECFSHGECTKQSQLAVMVFLLTIVLINIAIALFVLLLCISFQNREKNYESEIERIKRRIELIKQVSHKPAGLKIINASLVFLL